MEAVLTETKGSQMVVTMLNGSNLQIYGEHDAQVSMSDSHGNLTEAETHFYATDLLGYDAILGWPWLQAYNPNIDWAYATWIWAQPSPVIKYTKATQFADTVEKVGHIFTVCFTLLHPKNNNSELEGIEAVKVVPLLEVTLQLVLLGTALRGAAYGITAQLF